MKTSIRILKVHGVAHCSVCEEKKTLCAKDEQLHAMPGGGYVCEECAVCLGFAQAILAQFHLVDCTETFQ